MRRSLLIAGLIAISQVAGANDDFNDVVLRAALAVREHEDRLAESRLRACEAVDEAPKAVDLGGRVFARDVEDSQVAPPARTVSAGRLATLP